MKSTTPLCLLFFCIALSCGTALGQSGNATLTGTVTDATGAVVPNAKVTVTNVATGVARTLETTAAGLYVLPGLIPGAYSLEVKAAGFGGRQVRDIRLVIDQTARIDVQLEVGTTQQQVTITGESPLLQTAESSVGYVVQSQQVLNLPLNGRYFTQLLQLSPGTYGSGTERNGMPVYDVNGQGGAYTFFRIDGIENNEREFGGASIPVSVDAIQEVKLQTANFSAEYGRSAAQVDVVVKSGTNQIHGTVFEFIRNDKLDAPQWTFSGPHTRNLLKRNQFGGSVGGPAKKDKLFYFFNYDATREVFSQPQLTAVPTNDMRSGVFPAGVIIFDPLTQRAFPNNTIPQNRWDAVTSKVFAYLPAPNLPGISNVSNAGLPLPPSQNYFYTPQRRQTINQYNLRLDYNRSNTNTYFVRYTYSSNYRVGDGPLATNVQGALNATEIANLGGQNLGGAWYHNFSPYLINELRGGIAHNPQEYQKADNSDWASKLGVKQFLESDAYPGFPHFNIGGVHLGSGDYRPLVVGEKPIQLTDTMTLIRGSHSLRLGGDFRRVNLLTYNNQLSTGLFNFNGAQTRDRAFPSTGTTFCPGGTASNGCAAGNAFADFLLGYLQSATKGTPIPPVPKYFSNWAFFINDSWTLTKKLNLSLGLRYEYQTRFHADPPYYTQPMVKNGEFSGIIAVANDSSGKMSSAVLPQALAMIPGAAVTCRSAGLPDNCLVSQKNAWQPRLGFAYQATKKTVVRGAVGIFYGSYSGNADTESCQSWPLVLTSLTPTNNQPPAGTAPPPSSMANPFAGAAAGTPTYANCAPPDRKLRSTYQWNLTIERMIGGSTILSVGYVASLTRHMDTTRTTFYNLPQPWGVVLASGQTQRRPFTQFSNVRQYESQDTSNYNSLQSKLERRFSKGLALTVAYTWSKTLAYTNGLSDPRYPRQDYGPSGTDLRHVLVVSPIYQVPVGKGQRFVNKGGVIDKVIGGWQVSGIITRRGGLPFTPTLSGTDQLRMNGGNGQDRPDRICSGTLSNPTVFRWFDPTCFAVPVQSTTPGALLRQGNSGYMILRGPSAFFADLGLGKSFQVTERYRLDFRTEMFNAFNHPVFGLPASGMAPAAIATFQSRITGVAANTLPRIIQFGMKLNF
ncbi:MAG: TonB-dependent receptor [Acidobacteria bacterium]|jgi:hypothetical protein|nr:TonB-dependent receptor [Acidobacteriota bacterium]